MNEDEKIDRALDQAFIEKCSEREEPQGNGPWKWQLIRQLERIASALEGKNDMQEIKTGPTKEIEITVNQDDRGGKAFCPVVERSTKFSHGSSSKGADSSVLCEVLSENVEKHPEENRTRLAKRQAKAPVRHATQALVKSYCDAFKLRYGLNPPIDGKAAGLATNLLKTLPLERAILLVQAYIQMDERWFIEKCHDFPTFTQNITKVAVALFNGTNDPQEKSYWARIFGGTGDQGNISAAGEGAPIQLAEQAQPALSPAIVDGATACK